MDVADSFQSVPGASDSDKVPKSCQSVPASKKLFREAAKKLAGVKHATICNQNWSSMYPIHFSGSFVYPIQLNSQENYKTVLKTRLYVLKRLTWNLNASCMYPIYSNWVGTGVADSAEVQNSCQSGPDIKKTFWRNTEKTRRREARNYLQSRLVLHVSDSF